MKKKVLGLFNKYIMILDLSTIDENLFSLGKSGRNVKLLYDKNNFQVCTSTLYTPFGVKNISRDWSNFNDYWIDCSLNQSLNENSTNFRNFTDMLDKKILELVNQNKDLFPNYQSNLEYCNILRVNGNYPKLIKLQLPRDKNGNFETFMFDENKEKIKINEDCIENILSKGKTFKCIIEPVRIWVYNGKIRSIWNIVQLKLTNQKEEQKNDSIGFNTINYNQLLIED